MNEQLDTTYTTESAPAMRRELQFGGQSFDGLLNTVSKTSHEVDSQKQELASTADLLLEAYEVDDSFFDAEDNAIGLLLASGLQLRALNTYDKTEQQQGDDIDIADYFAQTLFGPYSASHPYEDVKTSDQLDSHEKLALHRRYENKELSQQLRQWFRESDAMQKMNHEIGAQPETIHDFEVIVLSMAAKYHVDEIQALTGDSELNAQYTQQLFQRAELFMRDKKADPSDKLPSAYRTTMQGKSYLCIMEPTARIVLRGQHDLEDAPDNITSKAIALLQHEYAHTQDRLRLLDENRPDAGYIGISLEEYRAEVLSGRQDESGYDICTIAKAIKRVTQVDIAAIITSLPYGGSRDKPQFYGQLIAQLGLGLTAEFAGLMPETYADFQSPKSARELFKLCRSSKFTEHMYNTLTDQQISENLDRLGSSGKIRQKQYNFIRSFRLPAVTGLEL